MLKPTKHARPNYRMLAPFIEEVDRCGGSATFESSGYMPLSIDDLCYTFQGKKVYGMMHFYVQNGDLMRDPDMTVAVDREDGTVEPLTYQQDGLGMYQEVYTDEGKRYRPSLRTELDDFLRMWLKNIKEQGFDPSRKKK